MSKSSKIQYEVWAFPYDTNASPIPSSLDPTAPKQINVTKGIVAVSFERSKTNPASSCNLMGVGQPNKAMILGTWVIVKGYIKNKDSLVPKFVGQLSSMTTDYVTDGSGLKHRVTNYHIREWSSALMVPVRFDLSAIAGSAVAIALTAPNSMVQNDFLSQVFDVETYLKTQNISRSAYEMARYILALAGAIVSTNANDGKPILGVTMPSVPESVTNALGIDTTGINYDPSSPYATGLMDTVLGYMPVGVTYINGVLPQGVDNSDIYSTTTYSHPTVLGYGNRFSEGLNVWELLNSLCNPILNEVFTDLVYRYDATGENLFAQPTLFVRCKPYTLFTDMYNPDIFPTLEKSCYDNLPSTIIDPEYIVNARVAYTLDNSPTYFRILPMVDMLNNPDINNLVSQAVGTTALREEMLRFGGSEADFQTSYVSQGLSFSTPGIFSVEGWLKGMCALLKTWYGNNYKLPGMTLTLKDENIPFSLGSNVEFMSNGIVLVGHLEAYSCSITTLPSGQKTSTSVLQLSRVVTRNKITGFLEYLPEDSLSTLFFG
jgi:hypothetical protein